MPAGIHLHQYDPRRPPDDTRGKHPSLVPSFAPLFISLRAQASTHPPQKQPIAADNCAADNLKTSRSLATCLILASRHMAVHSIFVTPSYRRNIGGHHHGFLEALGRHHLTPMAACAVLVSSLPAPSAGRACAPGPLDPGNTSGQKKSASVTPTSHSQSRAELRYGVAMWVE